jgi:hypothetical protein
VGNNEVLNKLYLIKIILYLDCLLIEQRIVTYEPFFRFLINKETKRRLSSIPVRHISRFHVSSPSRARFLCYLTATKFWESST